MRRFTRSFFLITKTDTQVAGGKGANLGELTQAGFNVPRGFCVTSDALLHHVEYNHLEPIIDTIVAKFNYDDFEAIETQTAEIRFLITSGEIPQDLRSELVNAIREIVGPDDSFVAVRSSVAIKGTDISSFPGMMDTFHYLKGEEEIIKHIKMCWASLWTSRATFTRYHKKIDHKLGLIAPVVQKMVNPETAGVLFTANPITSKRDEMVIEANWRLGESLVSGKSMNDFFLIDKSTLTEKTRRIAKKTFMVCFDEEKGFGRKESTVDPDMMNAPTLSVDQVHELGEIGIKIEAHFDFPQDIEWAYERGKLFILQSRNIRSLKKIEGD
jgi:pyruvate,water dikinase